MSQEYLDAVTSRNPDHWFRFEETSGTSTVDAVTSSSRSLTLGSTGTLDASTGLANAGSALWLPGSWNPPANAAAFLNMGQMQTFWERTERTISFVMATTQGVTTNTSYVYGYEDDAIPGGDLVEHALAINRWYDYDPDTDSGVYIHEEGSLLGWYGYIDDYFGSWAGKWQWWMIRQQDLTVNWRDGEPHHWVLTEKLDPTGQGLNECRLWIDKQEQPLTIMQSGQLAELPVVAPRTYMPLGGRRYEGSFTGTIYGVAATYDEFIAFPGLLVQEDVDDLYDKLTTASEPEPEPEWQHIARVPVATLEYLDEDVTPGDYVYQVFPVVSD